MSEKIDCCVIGAGVVGLAIARRMALAGREVIVLETHAAIGMETSSRNSEVIHAGIYYPAGGLKARLCVAGKEMLYAYCAERGIAHRRLGKLIVATGDEELPILARYRASAAANGVHDLQPLSDEDAQQLEPEVRCAGALLSPSTGIIDSHALMLALQGDAEREGASVVFLSPVVSGRVENGGITLGVGGAEPMKITCRTVVNAAGLSAQAVAHAISGIPGSAIPPLYLAKGHYFTLPGKAPFSRLVYPVAGGGGLGVHVTLDLGGQAKFGPDVSWIEGVDYSFDESRAALFYQAIRRYYPELSDGALQPGYTGIRPKLSGPGKAAADFMIQGPREHGVPGLVSLYGIESPGLTASLAIAEHVAGLLDDGAGAKAK
ncbi:MAG: NAD(P)/FAD-dependent oxidoreductase [Betaproteobacteria bacterium]|nr:NAD(P)/FAD-dependent oxidoreductase [Betaproteobacteria bacterium]